MKKNVFAIALIFTIASIGTINAQTTGTFTDLRDGKNYKTVKIGKQVWLAENLAFKSDNGCWTYEDGQSSLSEYGYLYNWQTAIKICPTGWHLPSKNEFDILLDNYGGNESWNNANYTALINGGVSGFSALFGGWRDVEGYFGYVGEIGNFWSSSSRNINVAWNMIIYIDGKKAGMDYENFKKIGLSVRCIQSN